VPAWELSDGTSSVKLKGIKLSLYSFFNQTRHHEGVVGEWRYSSTHSFSSALHGDEWSASYPGHFTPRERALNTGCKKVGWATEPVWTRWRRQKFPTSAGPWTHDHPARRPVLYHWAIPDTILVACNVQASWKLYVWSSWQMRSTCICTENCGYYFSSCQ
jgi:hypothetical protein